MSASAFSRRDFARLFALGAAGAALPGPLAAMAAGGEASLAHAALRGASLAAGAIRLNANENPLGPCAAAMEAVAGLGTAHGRYPWDAERALIAKVAEVEGVPADHVAVFNGSSDPLARAVFAYTSPERSLVYAEPGYEAAARATSISGARARAVPLTGDLAHDTAAMCAADARAGLVYVCNPNNPTGTTTPHDRIVAALAAKPRGALLLVDEAYIHLCDEPSMAPLVTRHADLLVLRTFSKLYGMAGMRMGLAIAQPAVLDRLREFGMLTASTSGIAAAHASLAHGGLVAERKAYVRAAREQTFAALDRMGVRYHRSVSNCFMLDARRPATELAAAMAKEGVIIGRAWPVWPTWARISIGTPEEMAAFVQALGRVMA